MITVLSRVEPIRSVAMGGANSGISNDAALVTGNPCAAAQLPRSAVTLGGQQGFFGDTAGALSCSLKRGPGAMTIGAQYYTTAPIRVLGADGAVHAFTPQQDIALVAGYAAPVGPVLLAGAMVKMVRSVLFDEYRATGVALDGAVQARILPWLKAAVRVANAGTGLVFREDAVPFPAELRAGVALGWMVRPAVSGWQGDTLILAADVGRPLAASGTPRLHLGVEYRYAGLLAARGGLAVGGPEALARVAAGIGMTRGRFRLDYAIRFAGAFDLPHALSFTVAL